MLRLGIGHDLLLELGLDLVALEQVEDPAQADSLLEEGVAP